MQKVHELWTLIYDTVEIKFTVIVSLLEWPFSIAAQPKNSALFHKTMKLST